MKSRFLLTAAVCAFAALSLPASAAETTAAGSADVNAAVGGDVAVGGNKATVASGTSVKGGANASGDTAGSASGSATAVASGSGSGSLTVDQIDTSAPFGSLVINTTLPPADIDATLTAENRLELQNRCEVIVENPDRFDASSSQLCNAYIDWKKKAM